jgi:hypothetical protein
LIGTFEEQQERSDNPSGAMAACLDAVHKANVCGPSSLFPFHQLSARIFSSNTALSPLFGSSLHCCRPSSR